MTKAEKIILDYTASWEWSQIEKLDWTTAEVMDIFDSYFKAQKAEHNSDYEATLRVLSEWDEVGDEINLATYCEKRINSAEPNCT